MMSQFLPNISFARQEVHEPAMDLAQNAVNVLSEIKAKEKENMSRIFKINFRENKVYF